MAIDVLIWPTRSQAIHAIADHRMRQPVVPQYLRVADRVRGPDPVHFLPALEIRSIGYVIGRLHADPLLHRRRPHEVSLPISDNARGTGTAERCSTLHPLNKTVCIRRTVPSV